MNKRKMRMVALVLTAALSGAAQAALHDRGGGLIYDDVLNVTWLQDANYAKTSGYDADGAMDWQPAQEWATNLSYFDSVRGVVWDDWRLTSVSPINGTNFNYDFGYDGSTDWGYNMSAPGTAYAGSTASELAHMYYVTLGNQGFLTVTGGYSACHNNGSNCLLNSGPFINLEANVYWAGAINEPGPYNAMYFGTLSGGQAPINESTVAFYAWAVRDGDVAAVPEPETYAMLLIGLALVGAVARKRSQISPELGN